MSARTAIDGRELQEALEHYARTMGVTVYQIMADPNLALGALTWLLSLRRGW